jgi:hypothetical protein
MRRVDHMSVIVAVAIVFSSMAACSSDSPTTTGGGSPDDQIAMIVDHTSTDLAGIPRQWLDAAKANLHIAYGHTSHGSQLTTGMTGLVAFANGGGLGLSLPDDYFAWNGGGTGGALDLRDTPFPGASDLGNPDFTAWEAATRTYLNANTGVNVVVWSWCGQVSSASVANIDTYLSLMDGLESDYPGVTFVYMTGHLDGTGLDGNLHLRNEQIRAWCRSNNKVLFDFADIESYDPDGAWFGDMNANDACQYDSDGDSSLDSNWAAAWQASHTENVDWYNCPSAHSEPLNANLKARAAWWLWARVAGWDGFDS